MSGDVPDYYCRVCGLTSKPCMHTRATAPYGSEQAIWEASRKMFPPDKEAERLRAELAAARAEIERLHDAIEAADSMAASYGRGDLGRWEVELYTRRRAALAQEGGR